MSNDNDIYFEKIFNDYIKVKKVSDEIEFQYNFLEEGKIKISDMEVSSGSINYSLIKFLFEFLGSEDFFDSKNNDEKFTLVVDEIEKFSHPEMIYKLTDMIVKISRKIDIVVTTHSPIFLERIFYINKQLLKKGKLLDEQFKYTLKFSKEDEVFNIEDKNINEVIQNLNFRELKNLSNLLFSNKIFLLEGLNDNDFLENIIQSDDVFNGVYYTIIDCEGKKNIKKFYDITKKLGIIQKINICLFYDQDQNSEENLIKIKDEFKNNTIDIVFCPDIESTFFEIEEVCSLNGEKGKKNIKFQNTKLLKDNAKNLDMSYDWIIENTTLPKSKVQEKFNDIKKEIKSFLLKDL